MKNLTLLIKPAAGLCNMNCGYCFYRAESESRENRIMSRETADLLIKRAAVYSPDGLSVIFQGGEPTLAGLGFFEYFTKELNAAVKAPVGYSIQTNGLLIDDKFASFFRENNYLVGISLDGGRKTNDRYRRDKNGNSVLAEILTAINILRKHEVDFNILSVVDNENAADIEATYKYFKKHGFRNLQFIPFVDEQEGIALSPGEYEAFLKKIFDLWYADFNPENYISIRHIDNYLDILAGYRPENCAMCGICGGYFVIEANGDIYPCDFYCRDEYRTGNISDANPFEINEKHKKFIEESFIIHERCRECSCYALCRGGCRRDRTDDFTRNKYCEAYRGFFAYSADRLKRAAGVLAGR